MTSSQLANQVADNEARMNELALKSDADDRTIQTLLRQNHEQARSMEHLTNAHSIEIQRLRQERDEAVTKRVQVEGIINTICQLGLTGLEKLRDTSYIPQPQERERMLHNIPDKDEGDAPERVPYAPRRLDSDARQPIRRFSDDERLPPLKFLQQK